jgi:exopolysaccharide production protein ExoZ
METFIGRYFSKLANIYEPEHTGAAPRILAMEGLRGLAVGLVFLVHFGTLFSDYLAGSSVLFNVVGYATEAGNCGVDLFFALSGYLIYGGVLSKLVGYWKFIKRRIKRIYPTFLFVLSIYLFFSKVFPLESKIPSGFWNGFMYIVANVLLLPGVFPINPIITVSWSLSYELFFYLVIPFIIDWTGMRNWRSSHRLVFFLGLAGLILFFGQWYYHPRLVMFIAGIVVYELIKFHDLTFLKNRTVVASFVGLILLTVPTYKFLLDQNSYANIPTLFVGFGMLLLMAFQNGTIFQKVFSLSLIRWLGNVSYSYYLIHGLTLKAMIKFLTVMCPSWLTPRFCFWVWLPLAFLLTFVSSTILFILVEKPFSLTLRPSEISLDRTAPLAGLISRFVVQRK